VVWKPSLVAAFLLRPQKQALQFVVETPLMTDGHLKNKGYCHERTSKQHAKR
jgi:hypothetical protein